MQRRAIESDLAAVRPAAMWLDAILNEAALADELRNDMQVCLEEALANLIMHAEPANSEKHIAIAVDATRDGATLLVQDRCVPFDVTDISLIQAPWPGDEPRIGGQGIKLMRAMAGALEYKSQPSGNELHLRFGAAAKDDENRRVRGVAAFAKMPETALSRLLRDAERVRYAPGDALLQQGEASTFALILVEGAVEVINERADGAAPVAQISAPALIGEIGALAQLRRTATVRASTHAAALKITHDALLLVGRHQPDMLISVIGQLGQQTQNVNKVLGLYASGLAALERDDFDPAILTDLNNPTPDLRNFAAAFQRLAQRVTQERRARSELASAAVIQRAMLPSPLDESVIAGRCSAFAQMKPAREVGGDLYDLRMLDADRLVIAVGDVCGKGIPGSLFMCATVTALRIAAQQDSDLSAMIGHANDALCAQNAMSMFTTLFYGVIDLRNGRLDYVNCGHNQPLLLARGGSSSPLPGGGPPLGFFPGQAWSAQSVTLPAGEGLFVFSDGITEAMNAANEEYGDDRLAAALALLSDADAERLVHAVIEDATQFANGAEQSDDITGLAVRMRG